MKRSALSRYFMSLSGAVVLGLQATAALAAPPEIVIHSRADKAKLAAPNDAATRKLVLDKLLQEPRYKGQDIARVEVRFSPENGEQYLVAYIFYRTQYLFEIALVPLVGEKSTVERAIETNVTPERAEQVLKRGRMKSGVMGCPDPKAEAVFATPEQKFPTAVAGATKACENARLSGMKCNTLIGKAASLQAYKAYLTACPKLRVFGNVGHGSPNGIILADNEVLSSEWFKALSNEPLKRTVLYFNSCKVHNDPLLQSIRKAGARTFIGGNVNLTIGWSEEVFKCFWRETMAQSKRMEPSLKGCERDYYPGDKAGDHGFSGFPDTLTPVYPLPIHTPKSVSASREKVLSR